MPIDYVFIDDEGNLVGGTYVRPHDPSGDRPIWVSLDYLDAGDEDYQAEWVNPYPPYSQIGMPVNRPPTFVSGLPVRHPGGGHAKERIRRNQKLAKAATSPRRLRARGSSPTSAGSSRCPEGHYFSWTKKRCLKSKFA